MAASKSKGDNKRKADASSSGSRKKTSSADESPSLSEEKKDDVEVVKTDYIISVKKTTYVGDNGSKLNIFKDKKQALDWISTHNGSLKTFSTPNEAFTYVGETMQKREEANKENKDSNEELRASVLAYHNSQGRPKDPRGARAPTLSTVKITTQEDGGGNPDELDSGLVNTAMIHQRIAQKKSDDDSKYRLLCYISRFVYVEGGSIKCVISLRVTNEELLDFWAHKADWGKESLQICGVEAPSYFLTEFNELQSVQLRDIPFGENTGKVTTGRSGYFPVNLLMMIVEVGGKALTPAEYAQFILKRIKHIFGSKKYQSVYREVVCSYAPGKMTDTLADDDHLFWKVLRT